MYNGDIGVDFDSADNMIATDIIAHHNLGSCGVYLGAITPPAVGNTFTRITTYSNTNQGFCLGGSDNTIIQDSMIYNNGNIGMWVGAYAQNDVDGLTFRRNRVYGNKYGVMVQGATTENVALTYNLIYSNTEEGIYFKLASPSDIAYNNVLYANGKGLRVDDASTIANVRNNIFLDNATEIYVDADVNLALTVNYNDYYHTAGGTPFFWKGTSYNFVDWKTNSSQDANSINSDPLFTNAAGNDFTLQSSSPAINAGVDLGATYDDAIMPGSSWPSSVTTADQDLRGSGWEIGAYVYPVPQAPTIGTPSALSPSSIRWAFTDNSNDETGFKIYDSNDNTVNSATPDGLSYLDETGLSCGTSYSGRYIKAYNSYGESVASAVASSQSTNICGEGVIVGIIGSRGGTLGMAAPTIPPQTSAEPASPSQGGPGQIAQTPSAPPVLAPFIFTADLKLGMKGNDVKQLQIFLNQHLDVPLAKTGPGSPRNETDFFGPLTKAAVIRCQEQHAKEILAPWGLTKGTGFVGKTTRAKINELMMK